MKGVGLCSRSVAYEHWDSSCPMSDFQNTPKGGFQNLPGVQRQEHRAHNDDQTLVQLDAGEGVWGTYSGNLKTVDVKGG